MIQLVLNTVNMVINEKKEDHLTSVIVKPMCGTGITISLFFRQILGPLILCWAPDHFLLGAQLAPGEKSLVCFPG